MSIAVKQNISYPWHYVFEIFKERLNNYMGLPTKPLLTCKRKVRHIFSTGKKSILLDRINRMEDNFRLSGRKTKKSNPFQGEGLL